MAPPRSVDLRMGGCDCQFLVEDGQFLVEDGGSGFDWLAVKHYANRNQFISSVSSSSMSILYANCPVFLRCSSKKTRNLRDCVTCICTYLHWAQGHPGPRASKQTPAGAARKQAPQLAAAYSLFASPAVKKNWNVDLKISGRLSSHCSIASMFTYFHGTRFALHQPQRKKIEQDLGNENSLRVVPLGIHKSNHIYIYVYVYNEQITTNSNQ